MRVPAATAVIVVFGFLAAALAACGGADSGNGSEGTAETQSTADTLTAYTPPPGPLREAIEAARAYTPEPEEIETPLAQGEEAGITPYWFGDEFTFDGHLYIWERSFAYGDSLANELPSIGIGYSGTPGAGDISLRTYAPDESLDYRRELSRTLGPATEEQVDIKGWTGDVIWRIDDRGLLQPQVFLHNEDAAVLVHTGLAVGSDDSEGPLNDLDTLLAIIEEHLRPFPE